MSNYNRLLSRLYNVPLLIDEPTLNILSSLGDKLLAGSKLETGVASPTPATPAKVKNKTAIINVSDKLVNKATFGESGFSTYDSVKQNTLKAISEGAEKIGFNVSSPGGEFEGLFPTVDFIASLPEKYGVSTFAFSADTAHSAAYALFAAAQKTYATDYTSLGSIAVLADLINVSEADKKLGIQHYILRTKDDKALGNPHEEVTKELLDKIKIKLDKADEIFNNSVVKNRPNLTLSSIKKMKGSTFIGKEALELGLFDATVVDLDEAVALETSKTTNKGETMEVKTLEEYKQALATAESKITALEQEAAAFKLATNEGQATAVATAVQAERERCSSILKACSTLKLDSEKALVRIDNGTNSADSLEIMTAVAEGLGLNTAIDTSELTTTTTAQLNSKGKSENLTVELEGQVIDLSEVSKAVAAYKASGGKI